MDKKLEFPRGFLWGSAISAHQTEGNNVNSDWWAWEHSPKRIAELKQKGKIPADFQSGIACDFWNRYEQDFDLLQKLNQNAFRLSIEWAKIEPKEGEFDKEAIEHYKKILQALHDRGIKSFVTLHHFTLPKWFSDKGGFTKRRNVYFFVRYAEKAARDLGDFVDFWITFNEPELYSTLPYLTALWPPQMRSFFKARKVAKNLITAHKTATPVLKKITGKPVSLAYHISDLEPASFWSGFTTAMIHYWTNDYILNRTIQHCDYIGVNYYFHHHVGLFGLRHHTKHGHDETDLGWGIHPEGLERVLLLLRKYKKPIYVTENGIADAEDTNREKFIHDHLKYIHSAVEKGADVRGYLYWSLIDNFEWHEGFAPRFGLVKVDYKTQARKIRLSAYRYAEICKNNGFKISI